MQRSRKFILSSIVIVIFLLSFLSIVEVNGFAAGGGKAKRNSKKKSSYNKRASTNKGFGAPPPNLDEVIDSFITRYPFDANDKPCPCGGREDEDGKKMTTFGECCGPYIKGEKVCTTMTDVLRTRYTAFTWRDIKWVIDTTHETCGDYRKDKIAWAKDLNNGGMFDSFDFVNLHIGPEEIDSDKDENKGVIEFKVTMRKKDTGDDDGIEEGKETVVTERSVFIRDPANGTWKYSTGDVTSDVSGLTNTKLNL